MFSDFINAFDVSHEIFPIRIAVFLYYNLLRLIATAKLISWKISQQSNKIWRYEGWWKQLVPWPSLPAEPVHGETLEVYILDGHLVRLGHRKELQIHRDIHILAQLNRLSHASKHWSVSAYGWLHTIITKNYIINRN